MAFVKLFSSITESTIWGEPYALRIVWITMLAMADRDGIVGASIPGLARRANVSLEEAQAAIQLFLNPDPFSRTPDNEGRRIEVVDGGWSILNYFKYRETLDADDVRVKSAERSRRYRERKANRHNSVTLRHAASHHITPYHDIGEAEGEEVSSIQGTVVVPEASGIERKEVLFTSQKARSLPVNQFAPFRTQEHRNAFEEFWRGYWRKVAKTPAEKAYARLVTTKGIQRQVLSAMRAQSEEMLTRTPDVRPHAATWLNGKRWNDEITHAMETEDQRLDRVCKEMGLQ